MPKNTSRVTVTRTITYTTTYDLAGYPDKTAAECLTLLGGGSASSGPITLGELLAGSIANNGVISKPDWTTSGSASNVEGYITRPASTTLPLGTRVASVSPPSGYEAALGKLFVVTVSGATGAGTTEPNWVLVDGDPTTDSGVTYRTISKFATISNYVVGAQTKGAIVRPGTGSLKEYLVITAGTSNGTPAWATSPNDTVGQQINLPSAGVVVCIAGARLYAPLTAYAAGDLIKRVDGNTEEYLVTIGGRSSELATGSVSWPAISSTASLGTATIKRII